MISPRKLACLLLGASSTGFRDLACCHIFPTYERISFKVCSRKSIVYILTGFRGDPLTILDESFSWKQTFLKEGFYLLESLLIKK